MYEDQNLKHEKFITKSNSGVINGFLVPIYNIHDKFFDNDKKNSSRLISQ